MEFRDFLVLLAHGDGSDLFLTSGASPSGKFQGKIIPLEVGKLTPGRIRDIAYGIMNEKQRAEFEVKPEMNLAIQEKGIGRFRVNIFKQRNSVAMVVRNIKTDIPSMETLGLPPILKDVILSKRGLVLFVGGTGSGKSTSLAALIDHRNSTMDGHIITIEDPIEFVHPHKKSLVNQREVGVDTDSFEDALKNTLRQAPDVILIGEIRARETMEHAIAFAETGHLCLSTLHANNSNQALDRIINFFPEERRNQLLMDLSLNLRAFISQRLIPSIDGKRVAAIEILLGTPLVTDLIRKGDVHLIKEVMEKSEELGMQTFDAHLYHLYRQDKITIDEALRNADSTNNLKLRISLSENYSNEDEAQDHDSKGKPVHPSLQKPKVKTDGLSLTPIQDISKT
ncbi:MAG: type IV pili twitching motility protein PilT [Candidatus Methylumidiphilus alinenensis]|uniref:Type IV pili twitching motility protein PilT n=1 Tax=Candidatus Methylumidiphilus alinenensis TaxID=2202197 RepID=A0A2W4T1T6_9GAMM|nr:MAG: type IV pili twitching motility protein PilT [Candidatus Methylumidiphilus alinenensis]